MLDSDTTNFLTAMRDSIESKIESGNRESREAVQRVEDKISDLSREMGEQTVALQHHKDEDDRTHDNMFAEIAENRKLSTRSLKEKLTMGGSMLGVPAAIVAIAEWMRSSGQS
jgi:hypothetical protein